MEIRPNFRNQGVPRAEVGATIRCLAPVRFGRGVVDVGGSRNGNAAQVIHFVHVVDCAVNVDVADRGVDAREDALRLAERGGGGERVGEDDARLARRLVGLATIR